MIKKKEKYQLFFICNYLGEHVVCAAVLLSSMSTSEKLVNIKKILRGQEWRISSVEMFSDHCEVDKHQAAWQG